MTPPLGLCAQLACLWEAMARKPGNVCPGRDFEDVSYLDFVTSAAAIGPAFHAADSKRVGQTVLDAVISTRAVVSTNTNLGIILLLVPLAAMADDTPIGSVLERLDVQDAQLVYEAIRLANPGGMGRVAEQDVTDSPTETLRQVMERAADHDIIARQYANGFREVFESGLPVLSHALATHVHLEEAIVVCHLHLMAHHPDTLIARKRGIAIAQEAARRAQRVLDTGWPDRESGIVAMEELDTWLRADGHARNPGATADLVTACLFVALRQGIIRLPVDRSW